MNGSEASGEASEAVDAPCVGVRLSAISQKVACMLQRGRVAKPSVRGNHLSNTT